MNDHLPTQTATPESMPAEALMAEATISAGVAASLTILDATEFDPMAELRSRIVIHSGAKGTEEELAWLELRKTGITATDAPLLFKGTGAALEEVRKRKTEPRKAFSARATARGHAREPHVMAWAKRRFGVEPDGAMYRALDFSQHFATLDGLGSLDHWPFPVEVKTGEFDLTPGPLDANRVLQMEKVDGAWRRKNKFWLNGYYYQMQWQMHVLGAGRALFLWEQHDGGWPTPLPVSMEPEYCWVLRDQAVIDLILERGNQLLAELYDGSYDDQVDGYEELTAQWVYAKAQADDWAAKAKKINDAIAERIGDAESFGIETSSAKVTLVVTHPAPRFDEKLWESKAPKAHAAYVAAKERYTSVPAGSRYVKITPTNKGVGIEKESKNEQ